MSRRQVLAGVAATAGAGTLQVLRGSAAQAATRPVLRSGSTGSAVLSLQQRLTALGYWCGRPDGTFGHVTQQAVWAVQKAAGLGRDGVVGAGTWSALDRAVRPKPRASTGTVIEVNKSRQLLMVVVSGRLVYTLNTSTGSGERYYSGGEWRTARTPSGSFKVYRRYTVGWQTGPLGSMWKPAYWSRGWAIHGSASIPPYPASHGCCRISTSAMDMLYTRKAVPVGTRVHVY